MPMTRANTKVMKDNKGPVEEGIIDEMVSTLGSSLESVFQQAIGDTVTNEQLLSNPLALRGGWNHPLAWANTSPAVQASPLAPLLLGGEVQLGFPNDPFKDEIHNLQDHPPISTQGEQTEVKNMAKLYKEETVQQAIVKYLDRCELNGVTDRFELMLQNIDSRMRDLPPMWVIEMGELILQGAARRWQGLMAAAIRVSSVEVRRKIIEEKNRLKGKLEHHSGLAGLFNGIFTSRHQSQGLFPAAPDWRPWLIGASPSQTSYGGWGPWGEPPLRVRSPVLPSAPVHSCGYHHSMGASGLPCRYRVPLCGSPGP